jgi:hypothetical protein
MCKVGYPDKIEINERFNEDIRKLHDRKSFVDRVREKYLKATLMRLEGKKPKEISRELRMNEHSVFAITSKIKREFLKVKNHFNNIHDDLLEECIQKLKNELRLSE